MTIHVNIGEAKTRLSELVAAAERGEEVVIARAGKDVVRLVVTQASADRAQTARKAAVRAWMGRHRSAFPEEALDLALEPAFTAEELDRFEAKLIPPRA